MKIHVGVHDFPLHRRRTFQQCEVAEASALLTTRPRKKTVAEWREAAPAAFRFVVPAPPALTDPQWRKTRPTYWEEGAQGFTLGPEADRIFSALEMTAGMLKAHVTGGAAAHGQRPPLAESNAATSTGGRLDDQTASRRGGSRGSRGHTLLHQ